MSIFTWEVLNFHEELLYLVEPESLELQASSDAFRRILTSSSVLFRSTEQRPLRHLHLYPRWVTLEQLLKELASAHTQEDKDTHQTVRHDTDDQAMRLFAKRLPHLTSLQNSVDNVHILHTHLEPPSAQMPTGWAPASLTYLCLTFSVTTKLLSAVLCSTPTLLKLSVSQILEAGELDLCRLTPKLEHCRVACGWMTDRHLKISWPSTIRTVHLGRFWSKLAGLLAGLPSSVTSIYLKEMWPVRDKEQCAVLLKILEKTSTTIWLRQSCDQSWTLPIEMAELFYRFPGRVKMFVIA